MIESKDLIEEAYDVTVTSIKPCRGGYIMDTNLGKKHLRQCQCSENRILYVHAAKEHLYNKGFTNIDTYLVTSDNKPFMVIDEQNYVITPYFDARECEFSDDGDTIKASTALAYMHRLGKGFKYKNDAVPSDLGKLPDNLGRRYDEILRMRRKAERERGAFDYVYLGCVDKFIELAEESLSLLNGIEYPRLVNKTLHEGVICHHDYSYQNILIKGNVTYIVGFECCCEELRIYDLVNLLRRKMRKCNWDIQKASILLDAYVGIAPVSRDEIAVMTAMLLFPQKFWRVANRYYNSRRSWAQRNFTGMLEEVIAEYDDHIRFMKQFKKLF
ncbi:MAG TPA: CotS family spore coat protein [Clostridiaceae bacterium]|jgi:CotS family spore coat protein|nr:CotS family spore coat protein [Clostridiaceae bacterium]